MVERPKVRVGKSVAKQKITARLNEFKDLGENWDSGGADAVLPSTLLLAQKVADKLLELSVEIDFCVPMRNGGVQFEFRQNGECELEVHPTLELIFLRYDLAANLMSKEKTTLELLKNHVRQHP